MKTLILSTLLTALAIISYAQSPWEQKAELITDRVGLASAELNGLIYAIGGAIKTSVQVYDPEQDAWSTRAPMKTARCAFTCCTYNGKIYAVGGGESLWFDPISSIEAYDPAADEWTMIADMPRARRVCAAKVVDSKMYIFGGADETNNPISEVDVYDIETDSWFGVTEMPTPRKAIDAVLLDDKIYTLGGDEMGTVEVYDPSTDTWSDGAAMPIALQLMSACVIDQKIYVFGGYFGENTSSQPVGEVYDPASDTWSIVGDMPVGLYFHEAVSLNGKAYVFGGFLAPPPPWLSNKELFVYNAALDLRPSIKKVETDKLYAKPETDSITITTELSDTTGITLYAVVQTTDDSFIDSLRLFDDGLHEDGIADDGIYGNTWPVITTEHQYDIHLHVTRVSEDTVYQRIKKVDAFTSIGPLSVDHYNLGGDDFSPNPGDRIYFELALYNNGSTETAQEIKAEIHSLEPLVEMGANWRLFDDIAAGEIGVSKGGWYYMNISDDCPIDTEAQFQVDIYSGEMLFWTDTFSIMVEPPQNIESTMKREISIYPIPTRDQLTIEFDNIVSQVTSIKLYNITGEVVYSGYLNQTVSSPYIINLSSYEEGLYFLYISNDRYSYTDKVFKVE